LKFCEVFCFRAFRAWEGANLDFVAVANVDEPSSGPFDEFVEVLGRKVHALFRRQAGEVQAAGDEFGADAELQLGKRLGGCSRARAAHRARQVHVVQDCREVRKRRRQAAQRPVQPLWRDNQRPFDLVPVQLIGECVANALKFGERREQVAAIDFDAHGGRSL